MAPERAGGADRGTPWPAPGLSPRGLSLAGLGLSGRVGPLTQSLSPGRVTGLAGPNGSGKSSLLRLLARLEQPSAGQVFWQGQDSRAWDGAAGARRFGWLGGDEPADIPLKVWELVLAGRLDFQGRGSPAYPEALAWLERLGLKALAERPVPRLSQGERALAQLARVLHQNPAVLLLDEPWGPLDLRHRRQVKILLRHWVAEQPEQRLVLVAFHDLESDLSWMDDLWILDQGRSAYFGPAPAPASLIAQVWGLDGDPDSTEA